MAQQSAQHNPFMLMIHPELVLAAMEKSERLGQLNRHLCRPLDRPTPGSVIGATLAQEALDQGDSSPQAD